MAEVKFKIEDQSGHTWDFALGDHIADRAAALEEHGYSFHIAPQAGMLRTLLTVDRDGDHVVIASTDDPESIRLVARDVIQTAWDIHIGEAYDV